MNEQESPRILKIRSLLLRDLSEIFNRMGHEFYPGVMFTVTTVRITPDLSIAKVYLSMFPVKEKETVLKKVSEQSSRIRYELGKRVGKQMRVVPELKFFIDDSLDYIEKIDDLLKK
jgi:ribosome-binding factor A